VQILFDVIYEDSELLVVNKPAGLVCHPTKTDEFSSLISRARIFLGAGTRPQLINRLDRETSGVVLIAKEDSAARAARRLWESREVSKEYLAIVHGWVDQATGTITTGLGKDETSVVAIKDCVRADGLEARTDFIVERTFKNPLNPHGLAEATTVPHPAGALDPCFSLLRVIPHTGRKHQIRLHLAHIGHPIVGDKLYGGDEDLYLALVENRLTPEQWSRLILPYHALHAAELRFEWRGQLRVFQANPEPWFTAFCSPSFVHV
jgi:23S rRNA pseudouridine1911/1915/1917 synthase